MCHSTISSILTINKYYILIKLLKNEEEYVVDCTASRTRGRAFLTSIKLKCLLA